MLTLIFALILNHPATATAAYQATVAIETAQAMRIDRYERTERLGRWLDMLDGERQASLARYSPFSDNDDASPFEGE